MLLTLLLIPFITTMLLIIIPGENRTILKGVTLISTTISLLLTVILLLIYTPDTARNLTISLPWITALKTRFQIGIDTPALLLLLLSNTLFLLISMLISSRRKRLKLYLILMTFGSGAITGALLSLDLILFYFFWELMLLPFYLLIGIFGGDKRELATFKFLIYTLGGSLLILAALIMIFPYIQSYSLNYLTLHTIPPDLIPVIFALFFIGFAVKIPVLPLHNWLPDAHVEAPTEVSVILAGILLKLGLFALLRFLWPLFPEHLSLYQPYIAALGITALIYGSLLSWAQKDLKKGIAYSSISHLGIALFGLAIASETATTGAILLMITHGCSAALLFIVAGVIKDRYHSKQLSHLGGIAPGMPRLNRFMLLGILTAIALPMTGSFVAEFQIFSGGYASGGVLQILTLIAMIGLLINTFAMLRLYHRTMLGSPHHNHPEVVQDTTLRETVPLLLLSAAILWIGIFPDRIVRMIQSWTKENRIETVNIVQQPDHQSMKQQGKQI